MNLEQITWARSNKSHGRAARQHVHIVDSARDMIGASCWSLDHNSCRVSLFVTPQSPTSSATGDDMSTTVRWNSGV